MIALTDLAFPGFFRARTYEMGIYYGIRAGEKLVAMAGERISIPGYREISAVCTHPDYTGRGYAKILMNRLICEHAATGVTSFLHVSKSNARAVGIYERMGFITANTVPVWPISFH
jgi:predicted GNAT family acetyltransferase